MIRRANNYDTRHAKVHRNKVAGFMHESYKQRDVYIYTAKVTRDAGGDIEPLLCTGKTAKAANSWVSATPPPPPAPPRPAVLCLTRYCAWTKSRHGGNNGAIMSRAISLPVAHPTPPSPPPCRRARSDEG